VARKNTKKHESVEVPPSFAPVVATFSKDRQVSTDPARPRTIALQLGNLRSSRSDPKKRHRFPSPRGDFVRHACEKQAA
jgi:hypothetical protein